MKTKELQLVTYEQAKRLWKLGFDCDVDLHYRLVGDVTADNIDSLEGYYATDERVPIPSVALALNWMRDEHGVKYTIQDAGNLWWWHVRLLGRPIDQNYCDFEMSSHTATYEEAESALLDAMLTYLEKGDGYE